MKAARLREGNSSFTIEDVSEPALAPGTVIVDVEYAFLPPFFRALAAGAFPVTPQCPFTPGICAIGRVSAIGEGVGGVEIGQQVYCDTYTEVRSGNGASQYGFIGCFSPCASGDELFRRWPNGTFAEKVLLPAECVTPIPPDLEADGPRLCRLGWLGTAWGGLARGGMQPGDRVAIAGASGLVGSSAVLVATAMGAGEISLFSRRTEQLEPLFARDPRLRLGSGDQGFDIILECSGGDDVSGTESLLGQLARGGSLVLVGGLSRPLSVNVGTLMTASQCLRGSFWFPRDVPARLLRLIGHDALDLSMIEADVHALADIERAMEHSVESSGGLRQVVLAPD